MFNFLWSYGLAVKYYGLSHAMLMLMLWESLHAWPFFLKKRNRYVSSPKDCVVSYRALSHRSIDVDPAPHCSCAFLNSHAIPSQCQCRFRCRCEVNHNPSPISIPDNASPLPRLASLRFLHCRSGGICLKTEKGKKKEKKTRFVSPPPLSNMRCLDLLLRVCGRFSAIHDDELSSGNSSCDFWLWIRACSVRCHAREMQVDSG